MFNIIGFTGFICNYIENIVLLLQRGERMEKIKAFLNNKDSTNFDTIVTAIIATILTTIIIGLIKLTLEIIKIWILKAYNNIRIRVKSMKDLINKFVEDQKLYKSIYNAYSNKELEYDLTLDLRIIMAKYLFPNQKKILDKIKKENQSKINEEIKKIQDNMEIFNRQNDYKTPIILPKNPWE